jgi:HemX protein
MTVWLHLIALIQYAIAATLLAISFVRGTQTSPTVARGVLGLALAIHAWGLMMFTLRWSELPLVGLGPSLSTLGFLVGLGTLIASTLANATTVGLVLLPLVTILVGFATAFGVQPTGEAGDFQSIWFILHVILAFVGYVGLTVAFAAGLMYLLQFRELKSKHFGAIFRFFPPLDTLDRLGRKGLLIGFPFLTLAMIVGWGWLSRFDLMTSAASPKLTWVILSWFVFLGALLSRYGSGRRSQRGALVSVVGFVVVVVLYVVLRSQTAGNGGFM